MSVSEINRNPPLNINVHIYDVASDEKERTTQYHLRKPPNKTDVNGNQKDLTEREKLQISVVDRKIKSIMNLIIWAANNGKSLEFIASKDDGPLED